MRGSVAAGGREVSGAETSGQRDGSVRAASGGRRGSGVAVQWEGERSSDIAAAVADLGSYDRGCHV